MFASRGQKGARCLALAMLGLAVAGCQTTPDPADTLNGPTADGHRLLQRYCSSCHAVGRSDQSRHPEAPAFRTLSQSYPVSDLQESLAEGIMVGHPDMPEFQFPAKDVAAIISYLESIQQR